ncbi:CBO0543 family protein [Bacillus sp. CGMCC 1.16607]|uniref:CBO0543 family protein n=1 Tax=Bacillus sp. CGMCC 1.16607 TaxID=3351842 RepID=UPI00363F40D1
MKELEIMFEQIMEIKANLRNVEMEYWLTRDVLSGHWWFLFLINLLSFVFFIMIIDRQRILLITIAFIISFTLIGITNEVGNYFGLWSYPHQFLAFLRSFNAVDFATIPVIMTIIYQIFSNWKYYLIANIAMSAILGFIGVPIFVYFNFYKLHNWNNFYSFMTLLIVGSLIKLIVDFIEYKSNANV